MSQPVTVRLSDPSWDDLQQIARRERRSVSEVGARLVDEGLRGTRHPFIEFRSFGGERLACVRGGLPVWQLIMVAQDYDNAVEPIAEHLDLKPELVRAGLYYYEAYPEEIDLALKENDLGFDGLKAFLPNLQKVELPRETEADKTEVNG